MFCTYIREPHGRLACFYFSFHLPYISYHLLTLSLAIFLDISCPVPSFFFFLPDISWHFYQFISFCLFIYLLPSIQESYMIFTEYLLPTSHISLILSLSIINIFTSASYSLLTYPMSSFLTWHISLILFAGSFCRLFTSVQITVLASQVPLATFSHFLYSFRASHAIFSMQHSSSPQSLTIFSCISLITHHPFSLHISTILCMFYQYLRYLSCPLLAHL